MTEIDIVINIIIVILAAGVILFTCALMRMASKYDKISDEDWEEWCRRQAEIENHKYDTDRYT